MRIGPRGVAWRRLGRGEAMPEHEGETARLLETSETRWTTVKVDGRTWFDPDLQRRAWRAQTEREASRGARFAPFQRSGAARRDDLDSDELSEPHVRVQTWSIWVTPTQRRASFVVGHGSVDVVFDGPTFWSNGSDRSITNGGNRNVGHGQGDGQYLVETHDYPPLLRVTDESDGSRLGRSTIEAKSEIAIELEPHRLLKVHGLTTGDPDLLELSIDRERGVVLRAASWLDGRIYRIVEMTDVKFDLVFPPRAFAISPKYGPTWTTV